MSFPTLSTSFKEYALRTIGYFLNLVPSKSSTFDSYGGVDKMSTWFTPCSYMGVPSTSVETKGG